MRETTPLHATQLRAAEPQKNTKNPRQGGFTLASQWTCMLVGVGRVGMAGDNDMINPCVSRRFHWAEDGSSIGATIEGYYSAEKRCKVIRARMDTDERKIYPKRWQLLTGVL